MQAPLSKRWKIARKIPDEINEQLIEYPSILRQLLFNRGLLDSNQAQQYLFTEGSLFDPFLLTGMKTAVERIWNAIDRQESIAVYGDYDFDGVTATALMVQVFGCRIHPVPIKSVKRWARFTGQER